MTPVSTLWAARLVENPLQQHFGIMYSYMLFGAIVTCLENTTPSNPYLIFIILSISALSVYLLVFSIV